ncbi:DNA-binding FrmR family transcriptional regulator [Rossellomorea aquimaris]|uniref:DNA-binding FrmR family transcriptional regulator n=2 Tax=Rossellomorea aquimaris TaxID=189382 RepID=A0A366F2B1_9BACI|nr:DNA-binding FrmR family transcriptional regulator [Rossellomorea aquimaris]
MTTEKNEKEPEINPSVIQEEERVMDHVACSDEQVRKSHHSDNVKKNLVTRLNRIEGQIRGIKGLIERDTYCDDVITQISATQSALNSVAKILLEGHMKTCVLDRIQEGDTEVLDEVMVTIQKLMKK